MEIILSKKAVKTLNSFDKTTKERIITGIRGIPNGDIKSLQGYTDGRQRLRIGKYRIIYKYGNDELFIMDIGSRGDIYK